MELQRHYNLGGVGFKVYDSGHWELQGNCRRKNKEFGDWSLGLRVWGTWRFRLS